MKAKLKKGTVITTKLPTGETITLDESVIFTDNIEKGIVTLLEGKRVYFPINYNYPECGITEDLLDLEE